MKYAISLLLSCVLASITPASQAIPNTTPSNSDGRGWALAQSNPAELMRQASKNELANSYTHRPSMRYRLRKITAKTDTTKEIVETHTGGVARLIAMNGRPLSPSQEKQEMERLHAVYTDPAIEAHRRRNEIRDANRVEKFMRLLPNAFLYRSAGAVETSQGRMIRLTFTPNPKFSPPDFESRVMTGIRGEVLIDAQQLRVERIDGRIFTSVDFGWGILGKLYPGGTLLIEQSKTPTCGWQMTHLRLRLEGKALLFKSVDIQTDETAADYQPVPREWNYKDAVQWLLHKYSPPASAKE